MGEVYRATHIRTGEIVAVKLLLNAHGADMLQRFRNEAHIHEALRHPNIAAMREFIERGTTPAIAMEYIEGDSLDRRIRQSGGLTPHDALQLFAPIADAVAYMHQRGVLHRDIKATNVKIARDGSPRLLDFGIAKSAQSPKLTAEGAVIGTWHYLSPEQLQSGVADTRSDVWALGVLLYEMLTGRLPFDGGGVAQLTERILSAEYLPASRTHRMVTPALDRVIAQCLTVRVDKRYQSARELLNELQVISGARSVREPTAHARAPISAAWPTRFSPLVATLKRRVVAIGAPLGARGGASRSPSASIGLSLAVVTAVSLLIYVAAPRREDVGPVKEPRDSTLIAENHTTFDYTPPKVTDSQTVSVKTLELPADVWMNGRNVGTTPFTVTRLLGSEVQLTLKRQGYRDTVVTFPVLIGKPEYSYQLQPIPRDDPSPDAAHDDWHLVPNHLPSAPDMPPTDQPPVAYAGLALMLRRFFGRGTAPGNAALKSTQELSIPLDASGAALTFPTVSGLATDVGCVRSGNEDAVRVIRPDPGNTAARAGVLTVVCDGMGGHEGGEIASQLAIETVVEHFGKDAAEPGASLVHAVQQANQAVYEAAQREQKLHGMGTTCTALLVIGPLAFCAHVGDSRLYLIRDRDIFLMTEDHSEVMQLVRRGVITREEARVHPDKNVILRAIGVRRDVQVASWPQPFGVRAGDRFLVCSDGLYDLVEDADILDTVLAYDTQQACDRLVALAREHGGFDNISVAVLAIAPSSTPSGSVRPTRAAAVLS